MSLGEYLGAGSSVTKGLYHFNSNVLDSSGNGNSGTPTNVTYADGVFGKCASFNGSSSRINLSVFDTGTSNTYSARIKRSGAGTGEMIVFNLSGGTGKKGTAIRTNQSSGATRQYLNSGFSAWVNIDTNFQNDIWYNIVIVQSGSGTQSYVNGVAKGSDGGTGANSNTTATIGCNVGNVDYYNGQIDEVIIENRAWTAEEVKKYYTYTKGRFGIQ